ncbi:holin family protein [Paenibacillus sp. D51F]
MNGQNVINTVAGIAAGLISYAFGSWSQELAFLSLLIALDIVTGLTASVRKGSGLSSAVGALGLAKKGLTFLVILLAHRMDVLAGTDVIMVAAVWFYVANELVSVTENFGRAGLPLPDRLKDAITVLKAKGGVKDDVDSR